MGNISTNGTITASGFLGNASTATKLKTARTITLSNDLQGSASFDGSGNISISASNYQASIASSDTNTYPYHRIAYISNITGQWNDKDAIFEIRHTYNGGGYGRFKVSYRTNGTRTATQAAAKWLYRYNIASNAIIIGTYGVTGNSCYADIFYKTASTYARAEVVQVLGDRAWTLVSSTEASSAASHTECWASISDAATALHSQAYTNTYTSGDGGTVNVANKLGTSTVGGAAKPIYLDGGTATACSSTVGSATQPVYMNGGTITACTYTLGKSVPSNAVFTDTNTKVTNTLATTTKAYITGTTSSSTNTGTQVFDTGVYLSTTAGELVATKFTGALNGNASTATKLATARTISITGGSTGSATFDGSANASISVTNKTLASSNYGTSCISYFQGSVSNLTSALPENDSNNWNHFLIFNHGNGKTYYNVILNFPFHDLSKAAFSNLINGNQNAWNYFYTTANVLVQTSTPSSASFTNQIWLKPIS